jgi:hypothetical protein
MTDDRQKLEIIFQEIPAAMALWKGPDFVFENINPRYQQIFPDRVLLGRPFLEACPEFKDQPTTAPLVNLADQDLVWLFREDWRRPLEAM